MGYFIVHLLMSHYSFSGLSPTSPHSHNAHSPQTYHNTQLSSPHTLSPPNTSRPWPKSPNRSSHTPPVSAPSSQWYPGTRSRSPVSYTHLDVYKRQPQDCSCPSCGAPQPYLYRNNGKAGQLKCLSLIHI